MNSLADVWNPQQSTCCPVLKYYVRLKAFFFCLMLIQKIKWSETNLRHCISLYNFAQEKKNLYPPVNINFCCYEIMFYFEPNLPPRKTKKCDLDIIMLCRPLRPIWNFKKIDRFSRNFVRAYKTTNVMHWILFIRQILLLFSTCFEYQVLIFRRTQLYISSIWYRHSL